MSNQLILEIQEFNGGQAFKTEISFFKFPQFAHISGNIAGTTKKMSEKLTEITAGRSVDQYSPLFVSQQGRVFPKVTLKIGHSREGKSFIFTFHEALLSSYELRRTSDSNESTEQISFIFREFSYKEESPKAERQVITGDQRPQIKSASKR
jgi:type VI protein secretion system component Hcp